jgi:signal transduction histidine kinase
MLSGLRWRLTFLYLGFALALIAIVSIGTYALVDRDLQASTDLALRYRMAEAYLHFGQPLPPELAAAYNSWLGFRNIPTPTPIQIPISGQLNGGENEGELPGGSDNEIAESRDQEMYDSELASVFVLPISPGGTVIRPAGGQAPLVTPDAASIRAAIAGGSDLRTMTRDDGSHVRLLTYRLDTKGGPSVLQVGRSVDDQQRVLGQLLSALLLFGGAAGLLLAAGSWWMAGRAIYPAENAWKKQQSFVANASHELRTPLTLLRASAEVAARDLPPGSQARPLLADVIREADHMTKLVGDLLLLSRLDSDRLTLEIQPIPLARLMDELIREVQRVADEQAVQLHLVCEEITARGDPTRVRQVVLILLENALRHTPAGGEVFLTAEQRGAAITIEVRDTGSGISPEALPRIFDRFFSASQGGAGLGLAIAKGLAEAQGGRLALDSKPGEGTTARFSLPSAD